MCKGTIDLAEENQDHIFIKLLMLASDSKGAILLYGFCAPTGQPTTPWKFRDIEKSKRSIWSAILTKEETDAFLESLTRPGRISLGNRAFSSPETEKRPVVLTNDGSAQVPGPVTNFSVVQEYWNTDKGNLLHDIENALGAEGKEGFLQMQALLAWLREECGIDFSENGGRIGNLENFRIPPTQEQFEVRIHKECNLMRTTVLKGAGVTKNHIVNCTAEHRGRTVSNQTKLFGADVPSLDFYAEEPMSSVAIQIWEQESGDLVFSEAFTLVMRISLCMNLTSHIYRVRDPWSDKLFRSASNRSDVIRKLITTVRKTTQDRPVIIKSGTYGPIDAAMEQGQLLFAQYQGKKQKGAFIPNDQMDGQIDSFLKIREYMDSPSVKKVVLADPYFSILAAQKLLARIPRTDLELEIISSLTSADPDTGESGDVLTKYRQFLKENAGVLHQNLTIRNLRRGEKPVIHDRYLIRFFADGHMDGFMLGNSLNSMGHFYPFVVAPLDETVCYEVCDYLNGLCDPEIQAKAPKGLRVTCDTLCDFKYAPPVPKPIVQKAYPYAAWLPEDCMSDGELRVSEEDLPGAVAALWSHWNEEPTLTCEMISALGSTTDPWCAKDVVAALGTIEGAQAVFAAKLIERAKEAEQKQDQWNRVPQSNAFNRWALLHNQATPNRQGFDHLLLYAGHLWYRGNRWLRGGYDLLLWMDSLRFVQLLETLKSPLMFDVLATKMLFYPWSESLYHATASSRNFCVRLLGAEYLFHQLRERGLSFTEGRRALEGLVPELRALQVSRVLSRLVFQVRVSGRMQLGGTSAADAYRWGLERLSADLGMCEKAEQEQAIFWLYDCEPCSNCMLYMDLAHVVREAQVQESICDRVLDTAEENLTKADYERDISALADVYLDALEKRHPENAERVLLNGIVKWRVFETAAEPALKNYAYRKWHKDYLLAKRQIHILKSFLTRHPEAAKATKWLREWEPRLP